jgi:hypothetical protein
VAGEFSPLGDGHHPLDERERPRFRRTIHGPLISVDRSASDGEPTEMQ